MFKILKERLKTEFGNKIKRQINRIKSFNIIKTPQKSIKTITNKIISLRTQHYSNKYSKMISDYQPYITEQEENKILDVLVNAISNKDIGKELKQELNQISKNVRMKKECEKLISKISEFSNKLYSADIFPSVESEEQFEAISQKKLVDLNSDDLTFLKDISSRVQYQQNMIKKGSFRIDINTGLAVKSNYKSNSVQCYNTKVGKALAKFGLAIPMRDNFGNIFYANRKSIIAATSSSNSLIGKLLSKDKDIKNCFLTAFKKNIILNVSDLKTISDNILKAEEKFGIRDIRDPGLSFTMSKTVNLEIYSSLAMEGLNRETIRMNDEFDTISNLMTIETGEDDWSELDELINASQKEEIDKLVDQAVALAEEEDDDELDIDLMGADEEENIEQKAEDIIKELTEEFSSEFETEEMDDELAALEKELELEGASQYKTVGDVITEALERLMLSFDANEDLEQEFESLVNNISPDERDFLDELEALGMGMQGFDLPENINPIDLEIFKNSELNENLKIGPMEIYLKNKGDFIVADTDTPNQYILFTKNDAGVLISRSLEFSVNGKVSVDSKSHYDSFNSAMIDLNLKHSIDPLTIL